MTVLSVLLSALIPLSYSAIQTCSNQKRCDITPAPGDTIACGCGVKKCNIDVTGTNAKDITLYTFAEQTKLNCRDIDGCQAATVLGGILPPADILAQIDTTCTDLSLRSIEVDCEDNTACKDMNVTSYIPTIVEALAKDSFDEAILDCFGTGIGCELICSSTIANPPVIPNNILSCEGAKCDQQCTCTGVWCPGWTRSPTPAPVIERPDPPSPEIPPVVVLPTYVTCDGVTTPSGLCKRRPSENDIIVVPRSATVKTLEIKCNTKQQCKNIKVYSAANTTVVICGDAYQPCYDAIFNIGNIDAADIPAGYTAADFPDEQYNTVVMDCEGEDSCKQANVTIKGQMASNPMLMAMGPSSFSDGCLECDIDAPVLCKLMCSVASPQSCQESQCKGTCLQGSMKLAEAAPRIAKRTGVVTVVGEANGEINLDNTNAECLVDCSQKDQCNEIKINSNCNKTTVICGESSCKKAEINIGQLNNDNIPKKTALVQCNAPAACYEAKITLVGIFTAGAEVTAAMSNGLYKAEIISLTTDVIVNCDNGDGCKDLKIECADENQCICNGGSCTGLNADSNNAVTITPSPTTPTISPTKKPTPNPTTKPTTSPTSSDLIVYTPSASGVFLCLNNVGTCVLDCNNDVSQCDQGVVLISAANKTNVMCNKKDTCKEIKLILGRAITESDLEEYHIDTAYTTADFINDNAKSVHVNCSAESACQSAHIKALVSVSNGISIETKGQKDALKDGTVNIGVGQGQSCSLDCGDEGCIDTVWENVADCTCGEGESCPQSARLQAGINYVPHSAQMNAKKGSHYPTFLPTAIIVCISGGLICLVAFCIYYKYFTNEEKKIHEYLNNDGTYDTFNTQNALEMNQI